MPIAAEDQENIAPVANRVKAPADSGAGMRKPGRFNQFLQAASNEVRCQWDEQVAQDKQVEEAVILVEEWMTEAKDLDLAKQLADAFEKEVAMEKHLEAVKGEAAAIQAAVEERRRIKASAQAKSDQERADAQLAKRLLEDEERRETEHKHSLYEADAKYAESLAQFVTPIKDSKAEEKSRALPETPDVEHKDDVAVDPAALQRDFEFACAEQKAWEAEDQQRRLQQAQRDQELSRRLALGDLRTVFQVRKRREMEACYEKCLRDEATVATLWENASAEVEDVEGSVALTLLLPNIQKLTVTLLRNGKTLRIHAARLVLNKDVEPTPLNATFVAEFQLEGGDVKISPRDVVHVYASETGLLHVYIEDVNMDNGAEDKDCKHGSARSSSSLAGSSSFFRAMKQGFGRVFGKKA